MRGFRTVALAGLLSVSACEGTERTTTLRVFAASSLAESFADLAAGFEEEYPEVDVALTFGGSQLLRLQITQGAPAQLFASANRSHVEALVDEGFASEPVLFATTRLAVVVPADNPAGIESYADLPRSERLVIAADQVPLGEYTKQLLDESARSLGDLFTRRVHSAVVSRELNARLVRAKVALGEADAAIVYETDALAGGGIHTVTIPDEINPRASYHLASIPPAPESEVSRFVDFIRSAEGHAILRRHGFGAIPTASSAP